MVFGYTVEINTQGIKSAYTHTHSAMISSKENIILCKKEKVTVYRGAVNSICKHNYVNTDYCYNQAMLQLY